MITIILHLKNYLSEKSTFIRISNVTGFSTNTHAHSRKHLVALYIYEIAVAGMHFHREVERGILLPHLRRAI